jgi:AcrR family transcriptional regulator
VFSKFASLFKIINKLGSAERKEREKAELKELILTASKKILLSEGQEGLSIRKIAKAIEYSPATIYLYYTDKDAILHELMEIGFEMMNKYMSGAFTEADPIKRIHETGHAYVKFGLENKDWYHLMFNSDKPMKHIEKCKEDWDQGMSMFQFLVDSCSEALNMMGGSKLDPKILALQLWSCVHGLVNLAQTERLEIVETDQTHELISKTLESMLISVFHR